MKSSSNGEKDSLRAVSDMAGTTLKSYEQAFRIGLKVQEEAARWWNSMLGQTALVQGWQKRSPKPAGPAGSPLPAAHERMGEFMNWIQKSQSAGTALLQKALAAAQAPNLAESQAKWLDFWAFSLDTLCANAEALTGMGVKPLGRRGIPAAAGKDGNTYVALAQFFY